jgi:hypothetical protein
MGGVNGSSARRSSASRSSASRIAWGLCCVGAGGTFLVYLISSILTNGWQIDGFTSPLMPLDDAYIHFQYARQIAVGQFYVYNPGLPPTSGATSFLYPYLMAVGDLLGFNGLRLGLWAMIIAAVALTFSAYLVYRLAVVWGIGERWALFAPVVFILHGLIAWHFMSGMETGFVVLFTLLTAWGLADQRHRWALGGGALLALTRPEGALLGVIAAGVVLLRERRLSLWLALPILALGVQPAVNAALTGSAVSSGNAAKSLFGMIPFDLGVVVGRIMDNFTRLWRELLLPSDALVPFVFVLTLLSLVGVVRLWQQARRLEVIALVGWALAFALAVATLDTAFWHFRRYQMPLIALLFPLAFAAAAGTSRFARLALALAIIGGLASAAYSAVGMGRAYVTNVGYVRDQPLQMALWLRENAPQNALVAVHDVGMMRYMGGRTTLDIVGLTTPGAADYWRNGPGAVGELLDRMRPDLIASYGQGHGLGLGYLQDTPLYAGLLATYSVALDPAVNVALAADTQGIYRPDYDAADRAARPLSPYAAGEVIDHLDVADIASERAHGYDWRNLRPAGAFPSEYYAFGTLGCSSDCLAMDGGRRINGAESFTLDAGTAARDAILVTRLHPADAGTFDVYANGARVGTRVIPPLPGSFLEVATRIPGAFLAGESVNVRIVPDVAGDYMPYAHWLLTAADLPADTTPALAQYQGAALELASAEVLAEASRVEIRLRWRSDGDATGDYKVFVHLLDDDDAIIAQYDNRPGNGALPPGNWLSGSFSDTIVLEGMLPGRYRVVIGLYDPVTFTRLPPFDPEGAAVGDGGALLVDEVEIAEDG